LLRPEQQRQLQAPILIIGKELHHLPSENRGLNEAHSLLYANDVWRATSPHRGEYTDNTAIGVDVALFLNVGAQVSGDGFDDYRALLKAGHVHSNRKFCRPGREAPSHTATVVY
jgi:hypothetical protein